MSSFALKGNPKTWKGMANPPFSVYLPIYYPDPRPEDRHRLIMVGRVVI